MCRDLSEMTCFYVEKKEKRMYSGYIANLNPDYPFLLTMYRIRGYHFKYEWPSIEDEPVESLIFFGHNILNGVVKPFTRSKRITPKDGELVREVAGSDFEREVMQSENDVVIQFYSNVCDHCKKMSKRFEKVAAALQDDPSLTFLRYSVNENDIDVEQIYVGMEGGDEG